MIFEYVSLNENTQIAFVFVLGACFIGFLINRRITKAQDYERERVQQERRDRIMAQKPSVPAVVEH